MGKTILVSGIHTQSGSPLAERLLEKGNAVFGIGSVSSDPLKKEKDHPSYRYCRWNENSPLSSRNILLTGVNAFSEITDAFIVYEPQVDSRPFHELPTAAVSLAVDTTVKGHFYLIRDLLRYFMQKKTGNLVIAIYAGGRELLPPIDSAMIGALRDFGKALVSFYQNEPVSVQGLESSSANREDFLTAVLKAWEDRRKDQRSRWVVHTEKSGFLQNLSASWRK
jgi:hypothetical protein